MKKVEAWMQGKPHLTAMLATQAVASAEALCDLFSNEGFIARAVQGPTLAEREAWLSFWQDDRAWQKPFGEYLSQHAPLLLQADQETAIEKHLGELSGSTSVEAWLSKLFESLTGRFLLGVYLPCLFGHHVSPALLFQKASEESDMASFEKMLALDPLVLTHPGLHSLFYSGGKRPDQQRMALVAKGFSSPRPTLTRKQVKNGIAASILWITRLLDSPLKCPEIHRLFDAFSQDTGEGLRDLDLPASPESFYKGATRASEGLPPIPDPDKNLPKGVRDLMKRVV